MEQQKVIVVALLCGFCTFWISDRSQVMDVNVDKLLHLVMVYSGMEQKRGDVRLYLLKEHFHNQDDFVAELLAVTEVVH